MNRKFTLKEDRRTENNLSNAKGNYAIDLLWSMTCFFVLVSF